MAGGAPKGVRYANLWETNRPAKKAINAMVFHDYYKLLMKVIQETPRLSTEIVDMYDSRLNFMADSHLIYLRSKKTKRDDWATGSFRMTARDVEGVIREFDDQSKKKYEDTAPLSSNSAETEHQDKDKDTTDTQTQSSTEVPLQRKKRKPAQQVPPKAQTANTGE